MSVLFPKDLLFHRAKNNSAASQENTQKRKKISLSNEPNAHTAAVPEPLTGGESSQLAQTNSTTDQCFAASTVSPLSSPPLPWQI